MKAREKTMKFQMVTTLGALDNDMKQSKAAPDGSKMTTSMALAVVVNGSQKSMSKLQKGSYLIYSEEVERIGQSCVLYTK